MECNSQQLGRMPSGSQPSPVFYCKQRIQRVQSRSMSNEGLSSPDQGAARHRGTLSCGNSQRASEPAQAPWLCIDLDVHFQPSFCRHQTPQNWGLPKGATSQLTPYLLQQCPFLSTRTGVSQEPGMLTPIHTPGLISARPLCFQPSSIRSF